MFDALQNKLQSIYEIETAYQVSNFITSNQSLLALNQSDSQRFEMVLVHQEDDCLNISVYLNPKVIEAFSKTRAIDFNSMCYALEGISHFLYLIYNAEYDRSVTMLEMELQAEVDKFIFLLQSEKDYSIHKDLFQLHQELFENVEFHQSLTDSEKQRYEDANFFAGKFCLGLLKRHNNVDWQSMNQELRRFYRLPLQEKLNHISKLH